MLWIKLDSLVQMHLNLLHKEQFKIVEAIDGLIGNEIADMVAKSYKDAKITRTTSQGESIMSTQTEYKQNIKGNIHTT